MHSSTELKRGDFEISIAGQESTLADLLADFGEQSRLGVVLCEDFAAVGASTLILSAVTAFYDIQRARHPEGFFVYPDNFVFHVGGDRGSHNTLEFYPDHKEVFVPDDSERLLQAINDRGVTHLLLPEGRSGGGEFKAETLASARNRLREALIYSPSGRVSDADVEIKGTERADYYVWATLEVGRFADEMAAAGADPEAVDWVRDQDGRVADGIGSRILVERESLKSEGRTIETFRRVDVDIALSLI